MRKKVQAIITFSSTCPPTRWRRFFPKHQTSSAPEVAFLDVASLCNMPNEECSFGHAGHSTAQPFRWLVVRVDEKT